MAIKSFPYTSVDGDRKITASSEAERMDQIVGSGIIFDVPTSFECSKIDGSMNISVASGSAIVAGHTIISDVAETVPISASDSANPRIDFVVLESNINTDVRTGRIVVIKGTAAETPIEPALSTDSGVVQIKLTKVLVPPSVASLSTATLTDIRTACIGKHTHTYTQLPAVVSNMYQNGFINGDMQIWQMGTSIIPTSTNKYYTADMWQGINWNGSNSDSLTVSQVSYNPRVAKYALRAKRNTGTTVMGNIRIGYNYSTAESKKYIGKKITVSFSARVGINAAGTYVASIVTGSGTDQDIISSYTNPTDLAALFFTPSTSDAIFCFTTPSVIVDNVTELAFLITYTPSTATAGANDYIEITNCNWSATDFYVPFSPRNFAQELQDSMAYYEKSYSYAIVPGTNTSVGLYSHYGSTDMNGVVRFYIPFKVKKRNTPTITFYGGAGAAGVFNYFRNGASGTNSVTVDITNDNAINGYIATGVPWVVAGVDGHWVADARI